MCVAAYIHLPNQLSNRGSRAWRGLPQIVVSYCATKVILSLPVNLSKRTETQRRFGSGGRPVFKEVFDLRHISPKGEVLLSHTEEGSNPVV